MKQVIEFLISNPQYMKELTHLEQKRKRVPRHFERCIYKALSAYFESEMIEVGYWNKEAFERAIARLDYDTHNIIDSYSQL